MKCKQHPRYQVKRNPRSLCEQCWRMWIARKDGKPKRAGHEFCTNPDCGCMQW